VFIDTHEFSDPYLVKIASTFTIVYVYNSSCSSSYFRGVFLSVFIPRYGLNIEIIQRSEGVGTIQTISIKVSNNNFETINDVTVQFGEKGGIQHIGDMGPFSSVMITPESQDMNFDKVIVKANNGKMESVKFR
jgi:hypothetical protein